MSLVALDDGSTALTVNEECVCVVVTKDYSHVVNEECVCV